jgi:Aldehyde dehydrogenase family
MISEIQNDPEFNSEWETIGVTRAFVRRAAIGIIMCLGPYNYPLNETWAMVFAALLAGNVLILKIPTVGGLCHFLTSKCAGCVPMLLTLLWISSNLFTQWMPFPRLSPLVLSISSLALVEQLCLH